MVIYSISSQGVKHGNQCKFKLYLGNNCNYFLPSFVLILENIFNYNHFPILAGLFEMYS